MQSNSLLVAADMAAPPVTSVLPAPLHLTKFSVPPTLA